MHTTSAMHRNAPVPVYLPVSVKSLIFPLGEPEHHSENNSKADISEVRDRPKKSIRPKQTMAWDTATFQSAALHISPFFPFLTDVLTCP